MFVHSNNKDRSALDRLLWAKMVVLYVCAEMLESPTLAPLALGNLQTHLCVLR